MAQTDKADQTRERLLDEAEILFARKGFHAVSVREITARAKCNLAAVNYHFGNKQNLYLEVFSGRFVPRAKKVHAFFLKALAAKETNAPADVVHALAEAFLLGPLTEAERRRHHLLISRELAEPTEAFQRVADEAMLPMFENLIDHFQGFVPPETDRKELALKVLSVFAMVLHFNLARPIVTRMTGRDYDTAFKEELVHHLVEFAMHGLGMTETVEKP